MCAFAMGAMASMAATMTLLENIILRRPAAVKVFEEGIEIV